MPPCVVLASWGACFAGQFLTSIRSGRAEMSPTELLTFALLAIGFIVSVWQIQSLLSRKRAQSLTLAGQEIGFIFGGEDWTDKSQAPRLETALFAKGRDRRFKNIMWGQRDNSRVSIFDYSFLEGGGRHSYRCAQTVTSFSRNDAELPYFDLRPANTADRVWDALAHKNIRFDSNPEFSRRYVLKGALEDKVRVLFRAGLLSFLETLDPQRKWRIEGAGGTLIVYRLRKTVSATEIRGFLDETSSIARAFWSFTIR